MTRFLAVLACLLGLAGVAVAAPLDEALRHFASTKFNDIEAGVEAVAAAGEPQAAAILEALSDGRLLVQAAQRRVFIQEPDGALLEAATGTAAPADVAAAVLKPVRVNNRIRRALAGALGSLTLMSPSPAKRLEAAQAVLRSRDAAVLPNLEQALAAEREPMARDALTAARAAILVTSPSAAEADRLAAVEALGA